MYKILQAIVEGGLSKKSIVDFGVDDDTASGIRGLSTPACDELSLPAVTIPQSVVRNR